MSVNFSSLASRAMDVAISADFHTFYIFGYDMSAEYGACTEVIVEDIFLMAIKAGWVPPRGIIEVNGLAGGDPGWRVHINPEDTLDSVISFLQVSAPRKLLAACDESFCRVIPDSSAELGLEVTI